MSTQAEALLRGAASSTAHRAAVELLLDVLPDVGGPYIELYDDDTDEPVGWPNWSHLRTGHLAGLTLSRGERLIIRAASEIHGWSDLAQHLDADGQAKVRAAVAKALPR